MGRVTGILQRTGFRKGVLGTSRGWFAAWAAISAAKFVRGRLNREPKVVETVVLRPGEAVVISDTGVERRAFPG